MAGQEEEKPLIPKGHQPRTIGLWSLVAITYFAVAGGPEGTETMVQTGGPMLAIAGVIIIGVIWSIPVALMTAELATAFPENGGYTLWVGAAFGSAVGEMAGWLQFVSNSVDAAIYPGLFLSYLQETLREDLKSNPFISWGIKIVFILLITALNFAGIQSVGHGSLMFMLILLTPFITIVLISFTGFFTGETILGWKFDGHNVLESVPQPDWSSFIMVVLWNMGYWEGGSVCAGEVANVATVFPQAIGIVLVIVVLNYGLPIMAFAGLDNNWAAYDNGYYIHIAMEHCGLYFGLALGAAQCVSVTGLFANAMVKNSYMVCGMGEQGMLPTIFADRMPVTGAP
eukprot:768316-Hanusia_phi.AAC.4